MVADGSVGMKWNISNPAATFSIYNNVFTLFAVDTFGAWENRIGLDIRNSKSNKIVMYHQDPVADLGAIVDNGGSFTTYYIVQKDGTGNDIKVSQKGYTGSMDNLDVVNEITTPLITVPNIQSVDTEVSLDDDTATSFVASSEQQIILFTSESPNGSGMAMLKPKTTGAEALKLAGGDFFYATVGVLSGTTGGPDRVTVSAHTDGKIYIENRLGLALKFKWTSFAGFDS